MSRYTSSKPCAWAYPRHHDARHMTHGTILPMEHPAWVRRGYAAMHRIGVACALIAAAGLLLAGLHAVGGL